MHLFAVLLDLPEVPIERVQATLASLAAEFGLDLRTAWSAGSREDRVRAAGVHHAHERIGPRRYVERSDAALTLFDGLPVATEDGFDARDAGQLGRRWEHLETLLDGQFCAVRAELERPSVEVLMDTLGFVPVYLGTSGGGTVVSNSVWLIATLLGLDAPDPLGVSTFMGLGWAAGDRTLDRGVTVLAGGARHIIRPGAAIESKSHFGPAQIADRRKRRPLLDDAELAREMVALTGRAVSGIDRVACALTGGRDSRVVLACLRAAGAEPQYFTGGPEDIPDVIIARELAALLGLRHEVVRHDPNAAERDWTAAAARFMRQNDGLSSLLQLGDYLELSESGPPLGVKLGGMGGEIGRAGTGELTSAATNVPLLRSSVGAQRRLLALKARDPSGIVTAEAHREVARYLEDFYDARLQEGWRTHELQESFYIFQRIGRWAPTGTRRVAGTDDGFSPLCARVFLEYCLALTPAERYLERAHHRLLGHLDPVLRDHRFENPFRPQQRWFAPLHASLRFGATVAKLARERLPSRRTGAEESPVPRPEYPFPHAWFEGRLELMRELFDQPQSELWHVVSRARVQELLAGDEAERARHQAPLMRAATLFWHFHGSGGATGVPRQAGVAGDVSSA